MCSFPFITFFVHFSCYLKDFWGKIDAELEVLKFVLSNLQSKEIKYEIIDSLLEDNQDMLFFIQDIFSMQKESISQVFSNALLNYAIIPGLLHSIKFSEKGIFFLKNRS